MRISNSNHTNKEVDVGNVARTKKGGHAGASQSRKVEEGVAGIGDSTNVSLSSEAKAVSQANKIAKSDDVDQAKIDRIKAAINSGSYKPDYGKVADKMVDETLLQELS